MLHAETPAVEASSGLNLRILDQQEVDLGDHSIIFNRVETPVLKPRVEASIPPADVSQRPSAEELAEILRQEAKRDVLMFLSCTVYDRRIAEVRWTRDDGQYVLWSGVDFNHLRDMLYFESGDTCYTLFMGIGNESINDVRRWNSEVDADFELRNYEPDLRFPVPPTQFIGEIASRSVYRLVSFPQTGIDPEAKAALDSLHQYYETNRSRLTREYEDSEAENAARAEWLRANPPRPKNMTINFFPIRSSAGGQGKNGGAK